ncbi:MAG: polysaccharide deacetylase family protein [Burkholderiales bacterium]
MTAPAPARWRPPLLVRLSAGLHLIAVALVVIDPAAWAIALTLVIADHLLITAVGLWPRSTWLGANWNRLPAAARERNEISLTIDDGPDPEVTPQVLEILDRYQVKASFFCIADRAERYPELCREIVKRGHDVENHSRHHRHNFSLLGSRGYRREIEAAQAVLSALTGTQPQFFRAPAGLRNPFLDPVLQRLNLQLASWSVRGYDTRTRDANRVKHRLLRGLCPGAILLLHDGNAARTSDHVPVILAVLPELLNAAVAARLRFVSLRAARR